MEKGRIGMIADDRAQEQIATPVEETNDVDAAPPPRPFWSHHVLGYLCSPLLVALGVGLLKLERLLLSTFHFPGAPFFLIIVLVAIVWGLGPALLTVFLSMLALDYFYSASPFVLSPYLIAWNGVRQMLPFVIVGSITAIVIVQREAKRRQALVATCEQHKRVSQLEAIGEAIADAVVVYDREGRVIEVNGVARGMFKLADRANLQEDGLQERAVHMQVMSGDGQPLPPEQWPQVRMLRGDTLAGSDTVDITFRLQEGVDLYANVSGSPLRDQAGNIVGSVCIYRDVTERKHLEQQAQELTREALARASELEATFEAIADGVLIFDEHGSIQRTNKALRQLFDFSDDITFAERAKILALRDEQGNLLSLEQLPISRVLHGEVLAGTGAAELQMTGAQGQMLNISITGAPTSYADGSLSGAILVLRDVTKRRQLEKRIQQTLSALLAMATLVFETDVAHSESALTSATATHETIMRLVEMAHKTLGCVHTSITLADEKGVLQPSVLIGFSPEQEVVAQSLKEYKVLAPLLANLQREEEIVLDTTLSPFNQWEEVGVSHPLLVPIALNEQLIGVLSLDYGDAEHDYGPDEIALAQATAKLSALVFERDRLISERTEARAIEMSLRETKRRMEEFLGIASHELRTPLTAVSGNIQIGDMLLSRFLAKPTQDPEKVTALFKSLLLLFQRAYKQSELLNLLVNDLVDVSRIQSEKMQLNPALCDVGIILREAVDEQCQIAAPRSIGLFLPPEAVSVMADADRIGQVVMNYLTNALKYSRSEYTVEVRLVVEGKVARVEVSDHGLGLAQQEIEGVWERFYQVPGVKVQSGSSVGLGIGLHICRTIITQHHGEVGVRSTPGQGSTFWFTLPMEEGA